VYFEQREVKLSGPKYRYLRFELTTFNPQMTDQIDLTRSRLWSRRSGNGRRWRRRGVMSLAAGRTAGIDILSGLEDNIPGAKTSTLVPEISWTAIVRSPGAAIEPGTVDSDARCVVVAPIVIDEFHIRKAITPHSGIYG